VKFEIAEMSDGNDYTLRLVPCRGRSEEAIRDEFDVRAQRFRTHACRFSRASKTLSYPPEIFPGQRAYLPRRFLLPKTHRQIAQRHPPVPRVQPIRQGAACAPKSGHPSKWQSLEECHQPPRQKIEYSFHCYRKQIL